MALLIATGQPDWMSDGALARDLRASDQGIDIRTPAQMGNPDDIRMIAVSRMQGDLLGYLGNLELVQKLGAGVETILDHPDLPAHIRVTRLKPDAPAREIAEYILTYVLGRQRHVDQHRRDQAQRIWAPRAPAETPQTTVGILGLGHIGGRTAAMFRDLGFAVLGWSRSAKAIPGVTCLHGEDGLTRLLQQADHVAAILPSTAQTRDLFDAAMFSQMKPGATFLNVGRGDLVVESDLIAALDHDRPGHAVLDVLRTEPLPQASPLWDHPKVTLTPHVSGWHLGDALADVTENYRRLCSGAPLLHEVDRSQGY
ncbi:MAG: NAD(P)-binding domain-containing protein [Marinibacterium sp.]|nr:NAD(P)-binding domain-containing protein [Marinibacterium sp.]